MKKFNYLTALAVLTMLASCKKSKDLPEPPNQVPQVSIKVKGEPAKLWNQVTVIVNAADADGKIAAVELYANGKLIGADAQKPYEFKWDTHDFSDGTVTLRVEVTDNMDLVAKSEKEVQVFNTLVSYNLHNDFLPMSPDYKYFTFITGENGKLLYFKQIESLPFKANVVRPGDFNGEQFDVHFVHANPIKGGLRTYRQFSPGKFAPLNSDKRGKKIANSYMKFTDIPQHDYYTYGNFDDVELKPATAYQGSRYENLKLGYLYLDQGDKGLYKIIKELKAGVASTSLSTMGFEMEKHVLNIDKAMDWAVYDVYGHTSKGVNAPAVKLFSYFDAQLPALKVKYHTPDKAPEFDHYSSYVGFRVGTKMYEMSSFTGLISKVKPFDLKVQLNSHKLSDISMKISGSAYDVLESNYQLSNNGFSFSWVCFSADGNLVFPPLPSELTQAFSKFSNANLVFVAANVNLTTHEFDHLKGYKDFISTLSGQTGKTLREGGNYTTSMQVSMKPF